MQTEEKQKLADFLDLTQDFFNSGYKNQKKDYNFEEDSPVLVSDSADTIDKIAGEIKACRNCRLRGTRTNSVPGEGAADPLVMVIGEGPGMDEDKQGRPFVGKAGQLLDKMLNSIGLSRNSNTFIANVVKCRPPGNRDPSPDETASCAYFLEKQILLLKPKFILAAGRIAAQTLLKTTDSIGKLHGNMTELKIGGCFFPLLVTYHPAAVLRNDELRRPVWEDLKLLKSKIEDANKITNKTQNVSGSDNSEGK